MPRPLAELLDLEDSAWPGLQAEFAQAANPCEALPVAAESGAAGLMALQVTTHSTLGAIAFYTGGVLVDGGWLRLLGGGHPRLPRDLKGWNNLVWPGTPPRLPGALLVADDAVGGFFALNGGAFEGKLGDVFYLAPDTGAWEDLGLGYSAFVAWACQGDLAAFYEGARWPSWREDLRGLGGSLAYRVDPPLWAAGPPVDARHRRPLPVSELWELARP